MREEADAKQRIIEILAVLLILYYRTFNASTNYILIMLFLHSLHN